MEESIATLRRSLPVLPNRNTGRIPVQAQFSPPEGAHIVNMQAFTDTQDHLLTLIPEKKIMNLRTDSQMPVELSGPGNNSLLYLTKAQAPGQGSGPPKKG